MLRRTFCFLGAATLLGLAATGVLLAESLPASYAGLESTPLAGSSSCSRCEGLAQRVDDLTRRLQVLEAALVQTDRARTVWNQKLSATERVAAEEALHHVRSRTDAAKWQNLTVQECAVLPYLQNNALGMSNKLVVVLWVKGSAPGGSTREAKFTTSVKLREQDGRATVTDCSTR